jgi:uncharacterized membrane protein
MNRETFLRQLEYELRTLSAEERENAMQYYRDYLNEAEDVQAALDALGSPERVAADILREFGSVPAVSSRTKQTGGLRSWFTALDRGQKILLVFLLCVAAVCILPACLGVIGGLGGLLVGIVVCIVAVLFAAFLIFLVLAFAFFIAGIVALAAAFGAATLASAGIVVGVAMILLGLSLLCFAAFLWLCRTLFPAILRTVADCGHRLFSGGAS